MPFQIIIDDIVPHELDDAQACERARKLVAMHALSSEKRRLARRERIARDIDFDLAGIGKVEHRRQIRRARDRSIVARGEHGERASKHRSADTKAKRVLRLAAGDLARDVERREDAALEIVVPREPAELLGNVAPRNHEHGVALAHSVTDE